MEEVISKKVQNRKVELICIGIGIGALSIPFSFLGTVFFIWAIFIALTSMGVWYMFTKRVSRVTIAMMCVLCGVVMAGMRFEYKESVVPSALLSSYNGEEVTFSGIVKGEPDIREASVRYVLDIKSINGQHTEDISQNILVWGPLFPRAFHGEEISGSGTLSRPEAFVTDTGRVFAYDTYLKKDNIFFEIRTRDISIIPRHTFSPRGVIIDQKYFFIEKINQMIREPEASIVVGMLFGVQSALGDELEALLRYAGLIHIVVLSGYNITIVAETLRALFSRISGRTGIVMAMIGIAFFAVMVGLSATVVRASLMALVALYAQALSRRYDITRAFALTGALMIIHDPYIAAFDPSFQLSFIATAGMIWLVPRTEKFFSFISTRFEIRHIISATVATQIAVLPLIIYISGDFSVVSVVVNALVLPLVPIIMLFGFLAGVLGALATPLGFAFALCAQIFVTYMISISEFLVGLPFSVIHLPPLSALMVIALYGVLLICFAWGPRTPSTLAHLRSFAQSRSS